MKVHVEDSGKKPYQAPQLILYGDIRVITGSAGRTSLTGDVSGRQPYIKTA